MKRASDLVPTLIVILVVVLLATWIVRESAKNNKEVIEAVKQAQAERQKQVNETLEIIKAGMTEEEWQRANQSLNSLNHNSTP
jgi:Sec-independent protein translocase protein TatA